MPFYDFKCEDNHVSEELRSYDEMKMGIECPKCGKRETVFSSLGKIHADNAQFPGDFPCNVVVRENK